MELAQARLSSVIQVLRTRPAEVILIGSSLIVCCVSVLVLTITIVLLSQNNEMAYYKAPKNTSVYTSKDTNSTEKDTGSAGAEIAVDIAGAVIQPGIYFLPQGARLADLLKKAKGLSEQADLNNVARSLNLAKRLSDQEKVYIPSLGEVLPSVSNLPTPFASLQNPEDSASEGRLLSINSASKSELEALPGIGEITAEKIINGRPYTSIEDLSNNGILKPTIFSQIKSNISL